jgi:hypothetical protein
MPHPRALPYTDEPREINPRRQNAPLKVLPDVKASLKFCRIDEGRTLFHIIFPSLRVGVLKT